MSFVYWLLSIALGVILLFLVKIVFEYNYVILFLLQLIYDDVKYYVKKLTSVNCKYNKKKNKYELNFYVDDKEYCICFPKTEENNILVMDVNNVNVTQKFKKYFGPNSDFFGQDLTPKDLNLSDLSIWLNKKFFKFGEDEKILLKNLNQERE